MVKLEGVEFPSKYLNCYESVLITILKYLGLAEETPMVGTQACFALDKESLYISPRFNSLDEEWERVHGLVVETLSVTDEGDLRDKIAAKLSDDIPICLPVDLYFLPHTPHYGQLHQYHYIDIFGCDDGSYYLVCPYYRFMDWIDWDLLRTSFFSATIEDKELTFIPELRLETLSLEKVHNLLLESCRNMLGLAVPETLSSNAECAGLAGIRTLTNLLRELIGEWKEELPYSTLLNLSRCTMWIGYSRYWFHRLIQTCQDELLSADVASELQDQFANATQLWRAIGVRLGAGVHGSRPGMIEHVAVQLQKVYKQEERLFGSLLEALPDYEGGTL